ncbi:hypothetical protein GCM10010399_29310 [Dactylosporangium fulvum]|uniref:DUF4247 domain-containing protein n=1 Tax=Dactylosporangium fulvum TaxID=53359 RepID=A0ABY5WBZ3_9ACTN|nr:DUF4247 domain-containing protein [Dactylosporangium fulvum]UWP86203.1 DUF4247 domain-containing protein [Dactylosporangium fulvum]
MRRIWYVMAACLGVIGLFIGGLTLFSGSFSPRSYVSKHYQRAAVRDIGTDARAYVTTKSPTRVANEITGAWKPAGRYADGTGIYLRYSKDSVVLKPNGTGTLILVEPLRTAYNRYSGTVGGSGWVGRGDGNSGRGGGPGTGK